MRRFRLVGVPTDRDAETELLKERDGALRESVARRSNGIGGEAWSKMQAACMISRSRGSSTGWKCGEREKDCRGSRKIVQRKARRRDSDKGKRAREKRCRRETLQENSAMALSCMDLAVWFCFSYHDQPPLILHRSTLQLLREAQLTQSRRSSIHMSFLFRAPLSPCH